ncbi:hypothetical protein [Labilibaculum antarcticum]|uniref:Uncharacterized protein n=1 Tax=Labilibaculum antarcticum TaxID=1717717 RepID=A0A1Y1CEJ9_9BACT|nr:hypothetical protein [Labilibaculum antarcticum]BAX78740.1 hypothetical protein ALGA_0345 [Labilibaculum antarcticum]
MTNKIKITIGFLCLAAGVIYHFYYQGQIIIIDEETTDFLSGMLFGLGISLIVVSIFNPKKKRL